MGHLSITVRASQCVPSPPLLATTFQAQEVLKANGSLMMNAFLHSADVRAPHHRQGGGSRCIWLCNSVGFGKGLCLSRRYIRFDGEKLCLKVGKLPFWVSYFDRNFAPVEMCCSIYSGSLRHLSCFLFCFAAFEVNNPSRPWKMAEKLAHLCLSGSVFVPLFFPAWSGWRSGLSEWLGCSGAEVVQMY